MKTTNKPIKPLRNVIALIRDPLEEVSKVGVIIPVNPNTPLKTTGIIVFIGPDVNLVTVGNRVLFSANAGQNLDVDGASYLILDEGAVLAII